MSGNRRHSIVQEAAGEMLAASEETGLTQQASLDVREQIRSLLQRDYGRSLRKQLGCREIREITTDARRMVWPGLNREPVRLGPPKEFAKTWAGLGVDFQFAKLSWSEGLPLLGFYVRKTQGLLQRPLIFINTAHHPAQVGAAFMHEMGHHLTTQIFPSHKPAAHFLIYTGYGEHLDDPLELSADILVSLGMYPVAIARRILAGSHKGAWAERTPYELSNTTLASVFDYVGGRYQLSFGANISQRKKLQYLAGLIHYTKLRRALLDEYDI